MAPRPPLTAEPTWADSAVVRVGNREQWHDLERRHATTTLPAKMSRALMDSTRRLGKGEGHACTQLGTCVWAPEWLLAAFISRGCGVMHFEVWRVMCDRPPCARRWVQVAWGRIKGDRIWLTSFNGDDTGRKLGEERNQAVGIMEGWSIGRRSRWVMVDSESQPVQSAPVEQHNLHSQYCGRAMDVHTQPNCAPRSRRGEGRQVRAEAQRARSTGSGPPTCPCITYRPLSHPYH
jgi:hypothetical protein